MKERYSNSIYELVTFFKIIGKDRKKNIYGLMVLMLIASFGEVISISAVIPFFGILTNPQKLVNDNNIKYIFDHFKIISDNEIIILITAIFVALIAISGILRLLLIWNINKTSFLIGSEISNKLYEKALYQPYEEYVLSNSADLINNITIKSNFILDKAIIPALTLVCSMVIVSCILICLIYIGTESIFFIGFVIILVYSLVILIFKNKIKKNGEILSRDSGLIVKVLQEGISSLRDIIIENSQSLYLNKFNIVDKRFKEAQASSVFIGASPRFIIEAVGIILIAIIASYQATSGNFLEQIGIFAAIAIASQRVLPLLQQSYYSWTQITTGNNILSDVNKILFNPVRNPIGKRRGITFKKSIVLESVSYSYDGHVNVLKNINIEIKKGEIVGIVGKTGSGKSTLIDLLMGLLPPTKGGVFIDGIRLERDFIESWQDKISHVPQDIYLIDSDIHSNIIFNKQVLEPEKKVLEVAKIAQIHDDISKMTLGYKTRVGERGIRLSGGQKQRIGIARGLIKNSDVIFLDEATSALDKKTEEAVLKSICDLNNNLTIFMVTHSPAALKYCDYIIEIIDGEFNRIITPESI